MNWWIIYFAVMAIAIAFAAILTPICRSLAWKWNILDKPLAEGHKKHSTATPVLGGLAMVSAWSLVIIVGTVIMHLAPDILPEKLQLAARGLRSVVDQVYTIVGGAIAMFIIGMADDKRPMSAKFKLSLQIAVMAVVAKWGVQITLFSSNDFLRWLLTFSWMMVILNAINFYDNMDGLLSGVAAICAFIFMLAAATMGQYLVAILAAVTCGVACGFYIFNRNPASIFMGDGGSHFLGYMLGVIGAMVTYYKGTIEVQDPNLITPFLVPFMILALPLFDLGAVIIIRLRNNKPIYIGDHNHISHRFVRMGFSAKHSVRLIHLLCFVIGIGGIALLHSNLTAAALLLAQTAALFIFLTILHSRQKLSGNSHE
ncbi:MAG: undecaprenyl/decaprenyl-phosphate alpha-N-acetylglucosaminyl 1-phosphate transferase [Lentisphaeraceae bacterium]|nr:undecaprenyl/decaprenyl-phosphate alpha-N-acetylglucosaminyl 1-phosphate transferase [Lentisphaeraceae bacterium]